MLVFLLVGTSTAYTPILLAQLAPERSRPARTRLRSWLMRNWSAVGALLLLGIGSFLVGKAMLALV
jgi:hypothetical protein